MLNVSIPSNATRPALPAWRWPPADCPRPDPLAGFFDRSAAVMRFQPNDEVFAEEDAADAVYRVVDGVVRQCRFTEDGRRQIGEFHYAGDMFGLEAGRRRTASAEAVTPCRLQVVGRSQLLAAAREDSALASALWQASCDELHRVQEQLFLLGRACAAERVLSFLQATAERLGTPSVVDIPMSRQDMADHLGLNIETVSRTITQLRNEGAIRLEGARRVRLCEDDLMVA